MADFYPLDEAHYRYYKQSLLNLSEGRKIVVPVDSPQCGFYSTTWGGQRVPVALWYRSDRTMLCKLNTDFVEPLKHWNACGGHPITQDDYKRFMATGSWGDEDSPLLRNEPPEGVGVPQMIEDLSAEAEGWLEKHEILTQAAADTAQSYVARLRNYKGKAETEHKTAKAPHLEASRQVDAFWKPLIERAETAIARALEKITPYLRQKTEHAQIIAEKTGHEIIKPAAGRQNVVEGKRRATTLKEFTEAEIVDPPVAAAHFANNPKILEIIIGLAKVEYKATGKEAPGCKIIIEKRAV